MREGIDVRPEPSRGRDAYRDTHRGAYRDAPDDRASLRMTESASYLAEHMADVPVLVIACVLDRPPATRDIEPVAGFWGGILPAVLRLRAICIRQCL